jgi:hypothetical protein
MGRKPSLLARCVVAVVRPPLLLLRFVVDSVYAALFAWWRDDLLIRKSNKEFLADIRRFLGFLFNECNAQILPNHRDPPAYFDWALVTISIDSIILKFLRDRER